MSVILFNLVGMMNLHKEKLKKTLCLTKIEMSGSYPASKNTAEEGEQD